MSYCRFGEDSDVYVFFDGFGWHCGNCGLGLGCFFRSIPEMVGHLKRHIEAGHKVPEGVFKDLELELKTRRRWTGQPLTSEQLGGGRN